MLKRLAVIGGAVAGILVLRMKAKQQQAEQDLRTQATDDVHTPVPPVAPAPSPNGSSAPA